MDELLEEFGDGFYDEFHGINPENVRDDDYKKLFKQFGDEKFYEAGKEVEDKCYDQHCEIYNEDDDGSLIDEAYDRYRDEQINN